MSLLSNDNSILYKLFDNKSMKDTKLRYNKAFKLNYQLMLKKNNTYICDEFFHFYMKTA